MGGSQILGFLTIFPIWSIEVPSPWATRPPQRFSLKLMTANPTIWAQHPATAAPPASPVSPRAAHMAALLMGRVSTIPTITDTRTPMKKGWRSVAHIIAPPTSLAAAPIAGANHMERRAPEIIVTEGVTRISIFVSLDTIFPSSAAAMVIT